MEYLIKTGSERVAQQCKENIYAIQTLKDFQYVDRDGKDQGVNVREKAKQLVALLKDDERLKEERAHALKTKEKLAQTATGKCSPPLVCLDLARKGFCFACLGGVPPDRSQLIIISVGRSLGNLGSNFSPNLGDYWVILAT